MEQEQELCDCRVAGRANTKSSASVHDADVSYSFSCISCATEGTY